MRKLFLALAAVVLLASTTGAAYAHSRASAKVKVSVGNSSITVGHLSDDNNDEHASVFRATLRGKNEVPAVTTKSKGVMIIKFDKDDDEAPLKLTVFRGEDVTMAHLHCAPAGQNGPVIVTLIGEILGGFDLHGRVLKTHLENDNIVTGVSCPTPITNLDSLQTAMEKDEIYVNVHTLAHPAGEIRGQLKEVGD